MTRVVPGAAVVAVMAAAVLVMFGLGTKPALAVNPLPFPSGALPTLLSCPNYNGSDNNMVDIADVTLAISHYRNDYPDPNYWYLYDSMQVGSRGLMRIDDVTYVISKYRTICPVVDTQIAKATQAIANTSYVDKLCDEAGNYTTAVNCGGDPRFLIEDPTFLQSRGFYTTSIDVPGQGVHYGSFLGTAVFNPARPNALVYKSGRLVAQLYYAEGDDVGWGPDRNANKHAVNTDALPCLPSAQEPPGIGCGWAGTNDGWHWHENLCMIGLGSPNAHLNRLPSQSDCNTWAASIGITCTFPPSPNPNCIWRVAIGWMGHLWNWYPNANFTNAIDPSAPPWNLCQPVYCATGESNGRFADCFPDVQGWNAYNCPS